MTTFPFVKQQPAMAWPMMPFAPLVMPFDTSCGGKGPCERGQFCDAQGVCRTDDCVNQFKYGCQSDGGELQKVGGWVVGV